MISKNVLDFLEQLGANNSKEWMDEHRDWYKDVRAEFVDFVKKLMAVYAAINPAFGDLKLREVMFRINKDVRFSKDKSPYKPWLSAYFSPEWKSSPFVGPYVHVQPGNHSFVGWGFHNPEKWLLKAFRRYIARDYKKFNRLMKQKDFVWFFGSLTGDLLKTAPQGYTQDHPAIHYLRYKSFYFSHPVSDKEVTGSGFLAVCERSMRLAEPVHAYINTIVVAEREISDEEIFY